MEQESIMKMIPTSLSLHHLKKARVPLKRRMNIAKVAASLLSDLQTDLEAGESMVLPETEKVIHCYNIAFGYWKEFKEEIRQYVFSGREEEVNFYKLLKPSFTSVIEYYRLVYAALIFKPADRFKEYLFWKNELLLVEKFKTTNREFIRYLKGGNQKRDGEYFVTVTNTKVLIRNYDLNADFISSHDHLVALTNANEMYLEFINEKIASLKFSKGFK